jgi:nucleoside-diphosphate-sugar epimerase
VKILITGALGHIGSELVRYLPISSPELEIMMFDNLLTQRYCSLFDLDLRNNYEFIEGDILTSPIPKADVTIHLAAITDATSSFKNKRQVMEVNVKGSQRIAMECLKNKTALIFPSTTSVYGKPSPYSKSKLKVEKMLAKMVGLKYIVLRFGTVFGVSPGMRFHTAVNKFCWQAARGQSPTVWQTAMDQVRPYLALRDACGAIEFVMQKELFQGSVFDVITTNATVRRILDIIVKYVPKMGVEMVIERIMNQDTYEVSNLPFKNLGYEFASEFALDWDIEETIKLLGGINVHKRRL